jgi:hypothetical protein
MWVIITSTQVARRDGTCQGGFHPPLSALAIQPGQRHYLNHITLTQSATLPTGHMMVDWTYKGDTPSYVVCHQPTNRHSWQRGRKRFWTMLPLSSSIIQAICTFIESQSVIPK